MDMNLKCKECGQMFTISGKEAEWYKEKGFELPKRCPECRKSRRKNKSKEDKS